MDEMARKTRRLKLESWWGKVQELRVHPSRGRYKARDGALPHPNDEPVPTLGDL